MHSVTDQAHPTSPRGLSGLARRFWTRDDGSTTVFATVVFVLMVGIGGIAIDVMRYESQRVQLQYTLDRAVLAAASLGQTQNPRAVVENYFETAGFEGYRLRVNVEQGVNFRRVEARAEMETQTLFMNLFGQPMLTSPAAGAAEERVRNVEVSLVIDNSGSMNLSPTFRINDLRPAARDFVTTVMEANNNATGEQFVSVSLIPYDFTVNMGPTLASVFSLTNEHTYSTCARFYDADFNFSGSNPFIGIDPTVPLQRLGHFDAVTASAPIDWPVCREGTSGQILPWSNNIAQLHGAINALSPQGATASDVGMRWAVALLDPAARPALAGLVTNGMVHADFNGRPAAYNNPETLKIIVLMTDGENTQQYDLRPQFRSGPSPFWRDPNTGRFSVYYPYWNQFWQESADYWSHHPDGGSNAVQLDYRDLWEHISVRMLASRMFHSDSWNKRAGQWSSDNHWRANHVIQIRNQFEFHDIVDEFASDNGIVGDARLNAICQAAKNQGIVIFTIAFDAPPRGQSAMRACASSDAHYYDVDGLDISIAFNSIAQTINRLRLVQ
ncbi:TadE/TadG family type IV pilus assembly protein [Roseicyclus marinus]|uniref:TadE/TadG family type IV pilus assembly protein n=1 Tax=Roseicyclus marinus TaxID=2161673 RepID=UPI00240F8B19|nr:Tad domain-containing protein [Roseicyclus marinus]MDG3041876.1 Tad domain-containing protein [Roseicyclus marinus]